MKTFQQAQFAFTRHLRAPADNPAPADMEERRLGIYRELIFNNLAGFISGAFPVLKSLLQESTWNALVRNFLLHHRCQTPYFLEISQEFLTYLEQSPQQLQTCPPFTLELAHYEWVELALDVAEDELPAPFGTVLSPLDASPCISPLAWNLVYQYPVHQIGAGYQPQEKNETPVFLIAWRNRNDQVNFMEVNALTYGLVEWLQDNPGCSGRNALTAIASQIGHPDPAGLLPDGERLLHQLLEAEIIIGLN